MKKTYDLNGCTIVIPLEIDSKEREEHLQFLLKYFDKFFINHKIIIIEQGQESKVRIKKDCVRIEFIKKEKEFSSSYLCNLGVKLVKTPFFCKCDVDVFIHPKAIFKALQALKTSSNVCFIFPYNGVSFTIKNPLRAKFLNSFDFDALPFVKPEEADVIDFPYFTLKNKESTGLIHIFRTDIFKMLGGYNEEFIGWGYEDDEVVYRFKNLGHPRLLLDGFNAFHLDHPRHYENSHQSANLLKARMVKQLTPEDLKEYINKWNPFNP